MMEKLSIDRVKAFDENFEIIKDKIAAAAIKSGRNPEDITLLAATKTIPVEMINYAIKKGINYIGENRVQELLGKHDSLNSCKIDFIGHLQTNKVRQIIGKVERIQSVDSLRLAKYISDKSLEKNMRTKILIEVNIGSQESKGGVAPEKLLSLVEEIRNLPGIIIDGLMAIPPFYKDVERVRDSFFKMKQYCRFVKHVLHREKKIFEKVFR